MVVRELITLLGFKLNDTDAKKYDKQIDSTKQRQESLFSSMLKAQAIYGIASKAIGAAFSFARRSIFEVAGETEKYRASLGAMIGDQEKANQIIHDLDYSPLSDFYGTAAAIGGLQGLVTMGVQAEEASDILLRLGDIAGGSGEALKSLGLNMGQVFAKGKADATDLKQFVTQGFDVVGVVAQQTGKTREQVEKAGVTYEQTAAALRVLTSEGGKYYGLMQKNMNTIPGVIAQMKSFVAAVQEAIGFGVSNEIKELLKSILEIGRSMQETFVSTGIKVIKEVLIWIAMVHVAFVRLSNRLADAGGVFGNIKVMAQAFFSFFASLVRSIFPVILSVAEILIRAFGPIRAFIVPVLEALKPIAADVFGTINDMLEPIKKAVTGLTDEFGFVGDKIAELLGKVRPVLNNIMAAIKAAFGPIKAFVMPIIEALKPVFMDVFTIIGGLLDGVGEKTSGLAGFIEKLTPLFRELGQFVGDVIGFLWQFKDIILAVIVVKQAWAIAQWALNAAMNANPIGLIITAIGLLIFGIYELIKNWDKIAPAVMRAFQAIGDFFVSIGNAIASFFASIWSKITGFFASVAAFVQKNLTNIINVVITILFPVAGIVMALVRLIIKHWDTIKDAFIKVAQVVVNGIKAAWDNLVNIVKGIVDRIKAVWQGIAVFIAAIVGMVIFNVSRVWEGIVAIATGVIDRVKGVWRNLGDFISGLWDGIKVAVASFWNWLSDMASVVWDRIVDAFKNAASFIIKHWATIRDAFIKTAKAVVDGVKAAWEKIITVAKGIWDRVVGVVQAVVDRIKVVWERIVNAVAMVITMVRLVIERVWTGIVAFVQTVIDGITGAWQAFSGFMGGLWDGIKSIAGSVWEGIKNIVSGVIDGIRGVWQGLVDFISPFWDWLGQKASDIWEGIKNTFASAVDFIRGIWDGFVGFFTGAWEKIKGAFSTVADFLGFGGPEAEPAPVAANSGRPRSEPAPVAARGGGRPVKDMILTPEGRFDTDPADYIMAMKNPADLSGMVAYNAAGRANQYSSRQSVSINVASQITAAVPAGTPAEQKSALQRQAREAVHNEWAQVIQGARGLIPSPEGRRAM